MHLISISWSQDFLKSLNTLVISLLSDSLSGDRYANPPTSTPAPPQILPAYRVGWWVCIRSLRAKDISQQHTQWQNCAQRGPRQPGRAHSNRPPPGPSRQHTRYCRSPRCARRWALGLCRRAEGKKAQLACKPLWCTFPNQECRVGLPIFRKEERQYKFLDPLK